MPFLVDATLQDRCDAYADAIDDLPYPRTSPFCQHAVRMFADLAVLRNECYDHMDLTVLRRVLGLRQELVNYMLTSMEPVHLTMPYDSPHHAALTLLLGEERITPGRLGTVVKIPPRWKE